METTPLNLQDTPIDSSSQQSAVERMRPTISENMTAAEYVNTTHKMLQSNHKGSPPGILRWIGDAALAVFPIHRLYCALGLTGGLAAGSTVSALLSGYDLNGKAAPKDALPTFLQKAHGIVKYDPRSMETKDRWTKIGLMAIYAAGGFIGVTLGSRLAYKKTYEKNKKPEFLEDYIARVSQHQGDFWTPFAALGGIFGSSSGNTLIPLPGFNYGVPLAFRSTGIKDENMMLPGIGKVASGAATTMRYGVRDGLEAMCHYAVNNPSKDPTDLELYAFTVLGQVFGDKVKPSHVKYMVDEMHVIRDKYLEDNGIPKEKKKVALAEMEARFRGAGFEKLLHEDAMKDLDPMQVDFLSLKGMVGKVSNLDPVTHSKVVHEQEEYRSKLTARRQGILAEGLLTPAVDEAEFLPELPSFVSQTHPLESQQRTFAVPDMQKSIKSKDLPVHASFEDRAASSAKQTQIVRA